ncbi:lipopolysaccharide biosynthesis protein [Oscillochloris sp. ZM17-4]|uniref:Wzz/FepE/Etk N-terminal domain-containing protein n=1 Tax=Oscillochloris sp. ZM17-4 TaxID=2866714 RepID=UPI001C736445|nr:Wzz/FepE/Etk N-terminal domain-containing protein [Oscillochloris sp. ZM17-4]MBX0328821.1 lipopolysaccharide biosynthesis protein [Oscillochloris sp. ZM17-4]
MVRIVLLRLLESYFRHRWLYVLPIVIAVGAGAVFVSSTPPEYSASGRLYVSQQNLLADLTSSNTGGSWWVSAAQSTVTEINELLGTQAFIRTVIQKTDLEQGMSGGPDAVDETISYARSILSLQAAGDKLVDISATGDDPTIVYQIVVSTMDAYVQWKINNGYQESIAARTFFDNLMKPYQDDVDQARSDLITFLNAHPSPVRGDRPPAEQLELDRLQASVQRAEDRLNSARDNEESARLSQVQSESVTKQTYMVIDQPQVPQEAKVSTKTIATNMIIFLVVGVFLSVAGIAGGALIDRSLRFPIDVRHGLSLPVLAMVPVAQFIVLPAPAEQALPTPTLGATSAEAGKSESSLLQPQI